MKKWFVFIVIIMLIIISIIIYKYNFYKNQELKMIKLNQEYEQYTNNEITGTSLITLINKAMDTNNKNHIQKDKDGLFIQNNNSIKIDIKFIESDSIYPMEKIEKLGSERFIKNYAGTNFKCTKKEYHQNNKTIKYLLFEEMEVL